MRSEPYPITQVTPLVNGFSEITIHAPSLAEAALPGQYVILYPQQMIFRVGAEPPNNRSVYKIHEDCEAGEGNNLENSAAMGIEEKQSCYLLASQTESISLIIKQADTLITSKQIYLSPLLGVPLEPPSQNTFHLIQTKGNGLNALIFYLKKYRRFFHGIVLIEAEQFPFNPCPSRMLIQGMPSDVIAALPLFEDWGIPHRLASQTAQPGCFDGEASTLADIWLNATNHTMPIKQLVIAPSACLLPS